MRRAKSRGGTVFCLKGDVKMAHRRCKVREEDHGYQACQLGPDTLWLNLVGTFGVGTAAYWWARLMGGIAMAALYLQQDHWTWQLLFADDLHWAAGGSMGPLNLLLLVFFMVVAGVPFSWTKFRGGHSVEWVGYWVDYSRFEAGISEARANWIMKWIQRTLSDGAVLVRSLGEALGRFGFTAGALEHLRPFLGPLYAWQAAMPKGAFLQLPVMIKIILRYLLNQLQGRGPLQGGLRHGQRRGRRRLPGRRKGGR